MRLRDPRADKMGRTMAEDLGSLSHFSILYQKVYTFHAQSCVQKIKSVV